MTTTTTTTKAPRYFTPDRAFARNDLTRFSLHWGRTGMCAVSVRDWNGDRVPGIGAGGCGYDKRGRAVAQVLAALDPRGLVWLAQRYGMDTGSGDDHGRAGLYGLHWRIVPDLPARGVTRAARDAAEVRAAALTQKYRARSHKAPTRLPRGYAVAAGLDGACGYETVTRAALALGLAFDRIDTGKHSEAYAVRRVAAVLERYEYDDGRVSKPYLREAPTRARGAA